IALRPFTDLPLVGPPNLAAGRNFGPVFYWVLWLSRVVIGPWVDNLPHAGGIGLAVLQSAADVLLCAGLVRVTRSWMFSLAAVLVIASSPFDLALAAVIWNPVLAVALTKAATACVLLWHDRLTRGRRITIVALAWLAVQSHTPALPFAGAL